jgi:lipoyl synthase
VTTATRPSWLTLPARDDAALERMGALLADHDLHTVCESAECPNAGECFTALTCTFMILGDACTRSCRFCAVATARPAPPDPAEPARVAAAAAALGLRHVVVTSVTRDDLGDGGAAQFAATLAALRRLPGVTVELLVPDFAGDPVALATVLAAGPDVLGHNVETVPRLYAWVRPGAAYARSLALLQAAEAAGAFTKSGLMLGLGESLQEVVQVLADLRSVGCRAVTLGQYLCPSPAHLPVVDYLPPAAFAALERKAVAMGFRQVVAGPLVRSSYHAAAPESAAVASAAVLVAGGC